MVIDGALLKASMDKQKAHLVDIKRLTRLYIHLPFVNLQILTLYP